MESGAPIPAGPDVTVLIVDDDEGDRKLLRRAIRDAGIECEISEAETMREARALCEQRSFNCALLDFRMPGGNGVDGVAILLERRPNMGIVMVTGQGDELIAAEAIKRGAVDYLPKEKVSADRIGSILRNELEKAELRERVASQFESLEILGRALSRDLHAPLTRLSTLCELVLDALAQGNVERAKEGCEHIRKTSEEAEGLVATLLEFSRANSPDSQFETCDAKSMIVSAVARVHRIVYARRARITYDDPLPDVYCDASQISQVLENLISNGIRFCTAEVPHVHVGVEKNTGGWRFSVTDNGIGIASDRQEEIFEPFRRLHGRDDYEGVGLGLATCRTVVERHGGRIWCESEPGKGSTFLFTLPAQHGNTHQ